MEGHLCHSSLNPHVSPPFSREWQLIWGNFLWWNLRDSTLLCIYRTVWFHCCVWDRVTYMSPDTVTSYFKLETSSPLPPSRVSCRAHWMNGWMHEWMNRYPHVLRVRYVPGAVLSASHGWADWILTGTFCGCTSAWLSPNEGPTCLAPLQASAVIITVGRCQIIASGFWTC